jgi:hypothetical protein
VVILEGWFQIFRLNESTRGGMDQFLRNGMLKNSVFRCISAPATKKFLYFSIFGAPRNHPN